MIKLCVFDFDSTLMDGETIDFLASDYGVGDEVKAITKRAMAGELDFYESLTHRVALLKGMPLSRVKEICSDLPEMNGARELILNLKERGIKVVVFSGGFKTGTNAMQERLGFDINFANILHHKDGILSGSVGGEMMFDFSKGEMLLRLQKILDISQSETMCVGDGANDISMFKHSRLNFAFCANEILKKQATYCIEKKDLREILKYI
ncbi:phosphoserine phosphatase SerB [Campylobacter gastrosuis]|uniref:Phosphoserine phosphatase n=1 Tax=Campylobacter gastrosuis TaxID=2974576 RepID=A0ABT7HPB1_9BACT|nr:phosphoserine phosphatase SerB [Campylobacter gastrosuis]MDL0088739.1 phosphoserine phosphatase SerB [Campylobacter gastrosuis]